jgi:hypothetical protein
MKHRLRPWGQPRKIKSSVRNGQKSLLQFSRPAQYWWDLSELKLLPLRPAWIHRPLLSWTRTHHSNKVENFLNYFLVHQFLFESRWNIKSHNLYFPAHTNWKKKSTHSLRKYKVLDFTSPAEISIESSSDSMIK